MKGRVLIKEISEHSNRGIVLAGSVQAVRDQGGLVFIILRDITGNVQIVFSKKFPDALVIAKRLTAESVIKVAGVAVSQNQAPGGVEIEARSVEILSSADPQLPIPILGKDAQAVDQQLRLDWRWIDLRKPQNALIFKIWTVLEQAFRTYCVTSGYIEIHSPKTVITSTESGSELFEIKYFGKKAYLAQSPQLYKQMAMAAGFEKVFEVGPVFRANPSFTSRHDTEFTMYDVELSFIDSHFDLMVEEEKMMVAIFDAVLEKYGREIAEIYDQKLLAPTIPFPRLTLRAAKEILKKLGVPNERGEDLSPEEERSISKYILEKYGHDFVFIHDWPAKVRAFYSMREENDPSISRSFDLLYRGLEVTSGAQREHRYEILKNQIIGKGLNIEPFESYLNFFKYGCPPHGGFAPGPTRLLMKMLGFENVREVTYLYRGVNRLTP